MENKEMKSIMVAMAIVGVIAISSLIVSGVALKEILGAKEKTEEVKVGNVHLFNFKEDLVSNIYAGSTKTHLVSVAVSLGLNEDAKDFKGVLQEMIEKELVMRDMVIQLLREQTHQELSRPTSQSQLGEEMKRRINELFETEAIVEVYFSKFFVQ